MKEYCTIIWINQWEKPEKLELYSYTNKVSVFEMIAFPMEGGNNFLIKGIRANR